MATGFKIAEGYVEIHTALNRRAVQNAANSIVKDVNKQVRASNRQFEQTGTHIGRSIGRGASQSLGHSFRTMGMNPYVVAGIAVLASVLAPVFATAFTTALAVGLVGIFAFITYWVRKNDKVFKKAWTDLTDGVKDVLKRASEPMVQPLLNAFKIITKAVKDMEGPLKRIFGGFGKMIEPFTKGLMDLVKNMLPGLERSMDGMNAIFKALNVHLPKLGTAIGDFIAELTDDPELIERVVGLMITWLRQFLKVAGPFIEGLMVLFGGMANNWRAYRIIWDRFWANADPETINSVTGALKELWQAVKDVWQAYKDLASANTDEEIVTRSQTLADKLKVLWNKQNDVIREIWITLWNKIKEFWNTSVEPWLKERMRALLDYLILLVNQKLEEMKNQAVLKIQNFVTSVITWFLTLPVRVGAVLVAFGITVVNFFTELPGKVQNAISGLPGKVAKVFSDMSVKALYHVSYMVGQAVGTFLTLPGRAASAISSLPSRIASIFHKSRSDSASIASSTVSTVVNFFATLPSKVGSALGGLGGIVKKAVSGAGGWLYSAGRAIIQGLIDGINSKIPSLGSALNRLEGFIKDHKGPIEKDRKMLVPEGQAIMQGLQFGINSEIKSLRQQLQGITATIPTAVAAQQPTKTVATAAASGDTYHFEAGSIVLDASKIESIQQLMSMINGLRTTSRQFGIRPQVGMV